MKFRPCQAKDAIIQFLWLSQVLQYQEGMDKRHSQTHSLCLGYRHHGEERCVCRAGCFLKTSNQYICCALLSPGSHLR